MIAFLSLFLHVLISPFKTQARLEAEIVLLRHQLNVLRRRIPSKPQLAVVDRLLLRMALSTISVGVERRNYCPARDDHPVASGRLSPVLALGVTLARRSAQGPTRDPASNPRDESGQPTLGRAADPRRTVEARDRSRAVDRRQVHGQERPRAIADLEDFPSKSCGWHCRHGLPGRADGRLQAAVRSGHPPAPAPATDIPHGDDQSHGGGSPVRSPRPSRGTKHPTT